MKNVTVSNNKGTYVLACYSIFGSCRSPTPGKDYLLFNKKTKTNLPPGTCDPPNVYSVTLSYDTLSFLQDWSATFHQGAENIALLDGPPRPGIDDLVGFVHDNEVPVAAQE